LIVQPPVKLRRKKPDRENELSRRQFMQLVSASAAVSLAQGCQPDVPEKILPYVRQPLDVNPGEPRAYATSLLIDGFATGLLVQTREGRPIKVEGNPAHPASLGATSIYHQAAVLQLYDPDRARAVHHRRSPADSAKLESALAADRSDHGAGLRIVLEPTSSPLVLQLVDEVKRRHPASKITYYAPVPGSLPGAMSEHLFGAALVPLYHLGAAERIVAFDAEILETPYELRNAREFAARRHIERPNDTLNRLYAIESGLSVTGSVADHRLARPSWRVGMIAAAVSGELMSLPEAASAAAIKGRLDADERRFVQALARDLKQQPRGKTLIIPGDRQPLEVHALCHALNEQLGNIGATVDYLPSALAGARGDQDLAALVAEMQSGAVDTLVVLGPNPAYDAFADLDWSRATRRVAHMFYGGLYDNETAQDAEWFVPLSHPFEQWGDGRAYDGTLSFVQPLIRPLFGGRSVSELLSLLAGQPLVKDHTRLRVRFGESQQEGLTLQMSAAELKQHERVEVRTAFQEALARGFVEGTAFTPVASARVSSETLAEAVREVAATRSDGKLELSFVRSPTLHDGRFANVSWLLELPEPITKLTWDNAALMSPRTASALGVPELTSDDDDEYTVIELARAGRTLRLPVLRVPGHADESITVWLGYGHEGGEKLAHGVGANTYRLRTRDAVSFARDLQAHVLDEQYPLAITQRHTDQMVRPIALSATLDHYRREPNFTAESKGELPSLYRKLELPGPQWAMTIDMNMCNGCNACVIACQAENNVLVVGKEQVRNGRAMHWLRIDHYASPDKPERMVHQPMMCQHCETAPCEYVCPVNATEHSVDGLNEMVYNRCIGTRFCSNNCPYKVRRFNWFNWISHEVANAGSVELQRNPNVTVRARGVMEKCTYCVQRIRSSEIDARIEKREIRAGEVMTACQQACPSRAISFDSLTHPDTTMVKWRELDRSYEVLHETGARPRTMYLARIDNPNQELA
jgi:molybdopterin-containing oxidoreductase family iron-sulfur binding subunit